VFKVNIQVAYHLRTTIEVHETDTVASLISACKAEIGHYFVNNAMTVFHNGVDLATCSKRCTLADLNINKSTVLHADYKKALTGINDSNGFAIYVKTLTRKTLTFPGVHAHW
jgi:hypothetical protein